MASLNWSWKSTKTFGHAFLEHGAGKTIKSLADRARNLKGTSVVGQWLDNEKAAAFIKSTWDNLKEGENIVDIPKGLGRVVDAQENIVEATKAVIIKNSQGATNAIKTAYPVK
jgi:hypothetical protein